MQLRSATPNDAPRIRALIDLFTADGTLLPRTEGFIAAQACNFVVCETAADGIVGCAHLDEYSPSVAELRSLAVAPEAQGYGVGRALVAAVERLAAKRGHFLLFAVSNDEAYFRKFGFEPRHVPELDRERSEVSRWKGVYAKQLRPSPIANAA